MTHPISPIVKHSRATTLNQPLKQHGGEGSGNFDHAGRPGLVGGSAPDGVDNKDGSAGIVVYHGTVEQTVDEIKNNGIRASKASREAKKGFVYVTTDLESAKYWAEYKADFLGLDASKTTLVVFKIRVPDPELLSRDVQSQGQNDFQFKGDIPADWIVDSEVVDFYKRNAKQKGFYVPVLITEK